MTDQFASPADLTRYGRYRIAQAVGDPRPLYRFTGRVTADGSSGFRAEPGRYHLYVGWFCPWSQRAMIQRALNGLEAVISVSYVDSARDGRGWAFREAYGPDPVNGFRFLREAYEATEPGFDGHVSVPTLWDRVSGRVVSNDYATIDLDIATEFAQWSSGADSYPIGLRGQIDALDHWLGPAVNHGVVNAAGTGALANAARQRLSEAFAELDRRLRLHRYLLGEVITEADVRLWVSLVRYDPERYALTGSPASHLEEYPNLWGYARDLYQQPAFASTTRFETFACATRTEADWWTVHGRDLLAPVL